LSAGDGADAIRASDNDRAHVQAQLNDAFADGRLTRADWDERATTLSGPVTYGELARLTADLPAPFAVLPSVPAGPHQAQVQRTNGLAIAAIACALGQLLVGFPAGIAAIILGHKARRQIRRTGEQGNGLALTGLILGYVGTIGVAVLAGLLILFFVVEFRPS
jgi:Domain of unknown function (DUF4190)/Domain of unknown function (DUF1707)